MMQQYVRESTFSKQIDDCPHLENSRLKFNSDDVQLEERNQEFNPVRILRKYLEEGNTIQKQTKQSKNKKKPQKEKKIQSAASNSKAVSSTDSNSSNDQTGKYVIDYNFVVECAKYDHIATCQELLVFEQSTIFQKLRNQFTPVSTKSIKQKGIDDTDLLDNLNTRELFMNYLKLGEQEKHQCLKSKCLKRQSLEPMRRKKPSQSKDNFLTKILNIFRTIGTFIIKNGKRDYALRILGIILIILLAGLSLKYRYKIIRLVKIVLNLN